MEDESAFYRTCKYTTFLCALAIILIKKSYFKHLWSVYMFTLLLQGSCGYFYKKCFKKVNCESVILSSNQLLVCILGILL